MTPTVVKRFGQGALATPANLVTMLRILVAVPTLMLMHDRGSSWLTVALWAAITSTDSLDGWLARRDGATRSGAFLDPVADKLIVIGGLAVLADRGDFPWWPVVIIAIREIGISIVSLAWRAGAASSLPAQRWGKYKAFTQYIAVGGRALAVDGRLARRATRRALLLDRAHGRVGPRDRAPRLRRLAASGELTGVRVVGSRDAL